MTISAISSIECRHEGPWLIAYLEPMPNVDHPALELGRVSDLWLKVNPGARREFMQFMQEVAVEIVSGLSGGPVYVQPARRIKPGPG